MAAPRFKVLLRSLTAVLQLATVVIAVVWAVKYLSGYATRPTVTGPTTNDTGEPISNLFASLVMHAILRRGVTELARNDLPRSHDAAVHRSI